MECLVEAGHGPVEQRIQILGFSLSIVQFCVGYVFEAVWRIPEEGLKVQIYCEPPSVSPPKINICITRRLNSKNLCL